MAEKRKRRGTIPILLPQGGKGRSCLGWKHIAIPGYGAALIIFFKVLLLSPIRHYFPDCWAVNWSAAGAAHGNCTPPRISPSCPHCLSLWLDSEYRSTVSLRDSLPKLLWAGWVSLGHLSRPSFMRSSPHRWVLAHPPHRCSPSSGAR